MLYTNHAKPKKICFFIFKCAGFGYTSYHTRVTIYAYRMFIVSAAPVRKMRISFGNILHFSISGRKSDNLTPIRKLFIHEIIERLTFIIVYVSSNSIISSDMRVRCAVVNIIVSSLLTVNT